MWNKIKQIEYRHYIAVLLVLLSLFLAVFYYRPAITRTAATALDLLDAIRYYFDAVRHTEGAAPARVSALPVVDLSPILPWSAEEIQRKLEAFGGAFFRREYIAAYGMAVGQVMQLVSLFALPAVLLVWCLTRLIRAWLLRPTKKKGKAETAPLAFFKRVTRRPSLSLRAWFADTAAFVQTYPVYRRILLGIWLGSFNVYSILGGVLAFYFYFASSFDLVSALYLVVRLLVDLLVMLSAAAWYVWVVLGWFILCRVRDYIGYATLRAHERGNRGVVRSLPHAVMLEGAMGAGKTKTNVSMVLTKSIEMRDMALADMMEIECHYPHFPFAALREELRTAITEEEIGNLTPAANWMQERRATFFAAPAPERMWGYDFARYKMAHNNDLQITDLWDDLTDYAKLFFIYYLQSSLIYANFSIREDSASYGTGNMPLWDHDFFKRDPRLAPEESAYAHILDMDMLRLGRKFIEEPEHFGVIEFGCIDITEIEKERRNSLTLKEMKRLADECNQLNDGFEDYLKMIRHPSVIRNHVYIFLIADGNRAMDWSAGGREVCTIINVKAQSAEKLAMPFFTWACMLYDFFKQRHDGFMLEYENARDDMCLPVQLYHALCAFFLARHERAVNRFGYREVALGLQSGKMEGEEKEITWYHSYKKDYADRYATDCHAGLFAPRAARADHNVQSYPVYAATKATDEELDLVHSHFVAEARKKFK